MFNFTKCAVLIFLIKTASCYLFMCDFLKEPESYACNVTVFETTKSNYLMHVIGEHIGEHCDFDVTKIIVHNQKIPVIFPRNLCNFFPNVKIIDWQNGSLKVLNRLDLIGFKNLTQLIMSGNKLTELHPAVVRNSDNLKVLILSNNLIKRIGSSLLKYGPAVEYLDLRNNTCINMLFTKKEDFEDLVGVFEDECYYTSAIVTLHPHTRRSTTTPTTPFTIP